MAIAPLIEAIARREMKGTVFLPGEVGFMGATLGGRNDWGQYELPVGKSRWWIGRSAARWQSLRGFAAHYLASSGGALDPPPLFDVRRRSRRKTVAGTGQDDLGCAGLDGSKRHDI
jgi:hypothetical protein